MHWTGQTREREKIDAARFAARFARKNIPCVGDDIKAQLTAGTYTIFKGPIMDNKGKTVIAAGTERGQKDPELEKMDYLVEGVIGATS